MHTGAGEDDDKQNEQTFAHNKSVTVAAAGTGTATETGATVGAAAADGRCGGGRACQQAVHFAFQQLPFFSLFSNGFFLCVVRLAGSACLTLFFPFLFFPLP